MADLSLLGGCLLSQILVLVQRMCLKINFHTSSHNPDNLRLQPPRFGLLKPSAVVSSYIGAAQFVVYRVSTPKQAAVVKTPAYFFVKAPNSFQPVAVWHLMAFGLAPLMAFNGSALLLTA